MALCVFALRYAHSGIDAPWYYWLLPYLLTAVYLVFAIWFIARLKRGFYIFLVLVIIGGAFGLIYELLWDRSFIPDALFNTIFYSQFIIIPGLLFTGFLINKWKK
jgi:hypothetical protein